MMADPDRQGDVHDQIGLYVVDERNQFIYLVGIDLAGGDLGLSGALELFLERVALGLGAACMQISSKTSLFWQHLWMATEATPPQPMIRAFPMVKRPPYCDMSWYGLEIGEGEQHLAHHLARNCGGYTAGV